VPKAIKRYIHTDWKLEEELTELFNRLGFGVPLHLHKPGNFGGLYVIFDLPSTANTDVVIKHNYGRIPVGCIQVAFKGSSFVPLTIKDMTNTEIIVSSPETNKKVCLLIW